MPAPNRRICLFLGAGASANAGVPPTVEFVDLFRKRLSRKPGTGPPARTFDPKLLKVLDGLLRVLKRWKMKTGGEDRVDVETLLDALNAAGDLKSHVSSALQYGRPVRVLSKKTELGAIQAALQRFIREKCYVGRSKIQYIHPLLPFVRIFGPIQVFTVNYDMVMESWFERNSCSYTDGFDLSWNPSTFYEDRYNFYLYKLHGSVTWYRTTDGRSLKIPIQLTQSRFTLATGGWAEPLMLYPAQKWVNSGVYLRLLNLLHETLSETEYVVVVGYSFRDDHFVRAFQEAAFANEKLRLILVDPQAESIYQEKLRTIRAPDGTGTSSALTGNVFRFPFFYERVIDSLYTTIWSAVTEAVLSDTTARRSAEAGGQPKWADIAMKHLEAGSLERPIELEGGSVDWTLQTDSYKMGFFARKAILLATASTAKRPRGDEIDESWGEFRRIARDRLSERLFSEFAGEWSIRITLDRKGTSKLPAEQLANELEPLFAFARRYRTYFQDSVGRPVELLDRILDLSKYLGTVPSGGIPLEVYAESRRLADPAGVDELVAGVAKLKTERKVLADGDAAFGALILRVERAHQIRVLDFFEPGSTPVETGEPTANPTAGQDLKGSL